MVLLLFCMSLFSFSQEVEIGPFERAISIINQGAYTDDKRTEPVTVEGLQAFQSDACSSPIQFKTLRKDAVMGCCLAHDFKYWLGGTYIQRKAADEQLLICVEKASPIPGFAFGVYAAVRNGGMPGTGKSYQWGYGWVNNPKYTATEKLMQKSPELNAYIEEEFERYQSALPIEANP